MLRTFLAINAPVANVRRIVDEARSLAAPIAALGAEVAWVPTANVHLTLKFLGATRPEAVEAIQGSLARGLAATGRSPFEIEIRGMGAFPDLNAPTVLWAGVRPSAALAALHKDVESWMSELGFAKEERAFHPHFTVGRVKTTAAGPSGIGAILSDKQNVVFGGARVAEVVVYESRTARAGVEYVALARVPFDKQGKSS